MGDCLNAEGSRSFKQLLLERNEAGIIDLAQRQIDAGAAMLDVSVALRTQSGETDRMRWTLAVLTSAVHVPLMIDSADSAVLTDTIGIPRATPVLNSISLQHGRDGIRPVVAAARARNASIVCLCIDGEGMARTRERKLAVAATLYELLVQEHGMPPGSVWIDPLVFPVATAEPTAATDTIEAIRAIAAAFPQARSIAGISDAGFRLPAPVRGIVERAFLHHCRAAGLDVALANPFRIAGTISDQDDRLADAIVLEANNVALQELIARHRQE